MQLYTLIHQDKSITHNIFRIQDNESIIYELYCTDFIGYVLPGKTLLDYTSLLSANDYKKNDDGLFNYFKDNMVEEASIGFRLRKTEETRTYLLEEIEHNDLISEKYIRQISI